MCGLFYDTLDLEEYLERRLEKAERLKEEVEEIEPLRDQLQEKLTDTRVAVSSLLELVRSSEFDEEPLEQFVTTVEEWEDGLDGDLLETPPKYGVLLIKKEKRCWLRKRSATYSRTFRNTCGISIPRRHEKSGKSSVWPIVSTENSREHVDKLLSTPR